MPYVWTELWLQLDFPGGTVNKKLPANSGDTDSIAGPGIVHMGLFAKTSKAVL